MPGLTLLAAHLLADFPLQSDEMARLKFSEPMVRAEHAMLHFGVYLLVSPFAFDHSLPGVTFALLASSLHFAIDTRRWAVPKDDAPWYPVALDQTLHIASLALAYNVVTL